MRTRLLCVLLFLAWTAERNGDPLLYCGLWRSPMSFFAPLFDSLPLVHQPAWTVLLVAMIPMCHLTGGALKNRAWPMDVAILLSVATIAFGLIWGLIRGGSAYWAYYQLVSLLTALLFGVLLLASVSTPADVRALGATIVAAAVVRGGLALFFYFAFVRGTEQYFPHMTSHDDSPLFVSAIVILACWALMRARWLTWIAIVFPMVVLLAAIKTNNRRVAWIELATSIVFFYLLLPSGRLRRRVNRWSLAIVPLLAIYVLVGWGRPGSLFAPLRAFDSTAGKNEDSSTMARNEENVNVVLTFIQHPVLGSGWGQPMIRASSFFANFGGGFDEMYPYTPHNSLAAVVAFSGLVGQFGILLVVPVAAFLGARACRLATTRADRAATIATVCCLPVWGIQAYADIGLQSLTNGLLLSVLMAVAGRVAVWTGAWPTPAGARRMFPHGLPAPSDPGAGPGPRSTLGMNRAKTSVLGDPAGQPLGRADPATALASVTVKRPWSVSRYKRY